jgi:hypothetical protein
MNALGEKLDVEITSSGSDLTFKCVGDFAEQETVITEIQLHDEGSEDAWFHGDCPGYFPVEASCAFHQVYKPAPVLSCI